MDPIYFLCWCLVNYELYNIINYKATIAFIIGSCAYIFLYKKKHFDYDSFKRKYKVWIPNLKQLHFYKRDTHIKKIEKNIYGFSDSYS